MTSAKKARANCGNAQVSTGPKTARGKARAAQNARRHGLSLAVISDPVLSEKVEALTREIVGEVAGDDIYQLARRIAEAEIDLRRVRSARYQFLSDTLNDPNYEPRASVLEKVAVLRDRLRPNAPEIPMATLMEYLNTKPQDTHKLATILPSEVKRLSAMDRYERRALSHRKFAIRAFDLARRQAMRALGSQPPTAGSD
jgi:hypothetical protein